jgi:hypothetical protein
LYSFAAGFFMPEKPEKSTKKQKGIALGIALGIAKECF